MYGGEVYMDTTKFIEEGKGILGIEFGSTRIKAILINDSYQVIASGDFEWENHLENGFWTYHEDEIWTGLQTSYSNLKQDVKAKYGVDLKEVKAMGFSAMMHGYLAFDNKGNMLVPFRTWRNATTAEAAKILREKFQYNIPERWSIAHLYQAILNKESHVSDIDYITTLAGYVHWKLTGEKCLGVGDASGMFPIDPKTGNYDQGKMEIFNKLVEGKNLPWNLCDILPEVKTAGEVAGYLTSEGAKLLDPSGDLKPGCPLAPAEGDAGTGMVATNSVKQRTGNVSAGTSVFAMVVLESELQNFYPQIDMVTTPDGSLVAMVHANNCTSDINAWVNILKESMEAYGVEVDTGKLYTTLFNKALEGDADCGGLLTYGFISGENIMECPTGRPMYIRSENARFNLANFMRSHIYSAFGALKVGMDLLQKEEKIAIDTLYGHGGIFKTPGVAQRFLAAAMNTPISVMATAGEGGPWGMAVLAAYLTESANMKLEDFLEKEVFKGSDIDTIAPEDNEVAGFETYIDSFKSVIGAEREAINGMN